MPTNYYQQIRRKFILAVATVLTGLVGLFFWESAREYRVTISGVEKRSASYANALKEHAERVFGEADNTLQGLIEEIGANGGLPYTQQKSFYRLLRNRQKSGPQLSSIYVVDKNGDIVAHSQEFRMKPINLTDRDYYLHHRDNPSSGLFISKPFISRVSGTRRFSISRPLKDGKGQFNGLVSATFEADYFQKFYKTIDLGNNGRIILSTTAGDILVIEPLLEKPFAQDYRSSVLFSKYMLNALTGTHHAVSPISNTMRIMSYSRFAGYPVVAIVSIDKQDVVGQWRVTFYKQGAIVFLLSVFIVVLSFLFLRQLRRFEMKSLQLEAQQQETVVKAEMIDSALDAILLLDEKGCLLQFNNALCSLTGRSRSELETMKLQDFVSSNRVDKVEDSIRQILPSGQTVFESEFVQASGAVVPIGGYARSVEIGQRQLVLSVIRDISARKAYEQTLIKSELRERICAEILERIAGNDPLPQLLAFIARAVEKESPGALCSIMLADEEANRLLSAAAPSLPDSYNRAVNRTRIAEGVGSCGTAAFRRKRVVVEDINNHPFWEGFAPVREAGLGSCWSEPIVSSAGQLLGTFAIYHHRPAVPGDEEIRLIEQAAAFAAIALERSRNEAERSRLELQLGQSQKMEAIGHLAGGVAHDFNNLLTPIIIYAELLKRTLSNEEKLLPQIDGIIKASQKARDLTQQLLSFGRNQIMQMQVVDLNEVISSFYSIVRRTLRESIDINLQLSSQAAIISADRSKLDQVVLNLAINAQDAIGETGKITIETGQVMIDDEYARLHPGMRVGDYILLAFKDDGCGMSDENLRHIFEPFFTTKQVGHGTGLGLANVYGIVKQHNGYIAAVSKLGGGTTFKIYFPMVNEQPVEVGDVAYPVADCAAGETILLVEDNEMVRVMTTELLEEFGYKVHVGESPEHALELVKHMSEKIDLLITDVVMPGMNGQQLFERINAERPEIERVLYMSGYTNNVIVNDGALEEGIHFLQKPFTVDALMIKVRDLLPPTK